MVEAPMIPIEYDDYQYVDDDSREKNEDAGTTRED